MIAVVMLQRVLARMSKWKKQVINVRGFKGFYVRGLKTVLTFSVNQEYNEAFRGVYFLRMRKKKKIQSNLVLVVILVLESKGLYL